MGVGGWWWWWGLSGLHFSSESRLFSLKYKENRRQYYCEHTQKPGYRAQELCESRGGRPGLPVPNKTYGFWGRKTTVKNKKEKKLGWPVARYSGPKFKIIRFGLRLIILIL